MDANGLRFWLLAESNHWRGREQAVYAADCRLLRLQSLRSWPVYTDPLAAAAVSASALERIPRAVDSNGSLGRYDATAQAIVVRSELPGEAVALPLEEQPRDFAVGFDGVVYALLSDRVRLHDLRGRWPDETVPTPGFSPWRLATVRSGGIWMVERATGRLARLAGSPLPSRPYAEYAADVFRPAPENCRPPTVTLCDEPGWASGERVLALDWHPQAGLGLLSASADGSHVRLRLFDERSGTLTTGWQLADCDHAYSFAWLESGKIALRLPGFTDAPVLDLTTADAAGQVQAGGDIYPLSAAAVEAPFVHKLGGPPQYPTDTGQGAGSAPLHKLSFGQLARHGEARNYQGAARHLLDSGSQQTVWHRLCAEASLPVHAGFIAWLAATESDEPPPVDQAEAWLPHGFGDIPKSSLPPQTASGVWERRPSELPNHPGLGPWQNMPNRAGLFTVLVQNPRQRVRRLRGRYLWVRVELFGDGRVGPEIAALRVYASRFSYRDHYLPRLYRESVYGESAKLPGVKLADLALPLADQLKPGEPIAQDLQDSLAAEGIRLGNAASLSEEQTGQAWRLQDGGRVWQLNKETESLAVYRPQATPADFLERMLGNFEGLLTEWEGRIAQAHGLTDPASTPAAHLDWLAAWVGIAFDPALPEPRRRDWLQAAPKLARYHGTQRGLALALDVASGGGVRGGEIIVLEDFRLRRLLATLLGVDLNDSKDPLLPGLVVSGNSVVGDTLTLGEAESAELLALFREELADSMEKNAVLAFYDRLAYRATVLVHQAVEPQDLGLIRRVVALEAPAHVDVRVETATWPFLVGIASLVGVDTYLGPARPRQPVRADVSGLGMGDYILGSNSLDPRRDGAVASLAAVAPVADAGEDFVATSAHSFQLDGSRSQAGAGHALTDFVWRLLPDS